ncbi:probable 2-oxoglutarate-dependent dioxygenase ANS [Jatropha curcas]|uniref:probable 2-oxoglutarate-dependent dioxygenase ANS n=1 Tax=Jatropha curcas TaxID=180498 RepID=UPI001893621E|nr:probable 2-oxoglutarate-dependent dioxygenase ANS [Jatropha curcas]
MEFALPMEEKHKYDREANSLEGHGNDPNVSKKIIFNQKVLDEYSAIMKSTSRFLLKAMARSLNLEKNCFLNAYGDEELIGARFNYYPEAASSDIFVGAEAHSDGSGITILLQDKEVEGLQVLKDGQWFRVAILPDALFVNVEDQLQIISNGIFKSPMHRVIVE